MTIKSDLLISLKTKHHEKISASTRFAFITAVFTGNYGFKFMRTYQRVLFGLTVK
jgi:hypothetical protein